MTASIVLYKTELNDLQKLLICLKQSATGVKIYLIDNSPTNLLEQEIILEDIIYIHNPSNPGFGAAHNIAIKMAIEAGSTYHFVINPDIYFEGNVLGSMLSYMDTNKDVGMMMPQILNENGTMQNLPKLLPSPLSILFRKFKKPQRAYQKFIDKYELRFVPKHVIYDAPILSGCFTLLNLNAIKEVGMYDDGYFMYFEDWDLSRRLHMKYRTLYFPNVSVYHGYESGANKNNKLFKIFVKSAIYYFNKWGWFFDANRKKVNNKTLAQFKV